MAEFKGFGEEPKGPSPMLVTLHNTSEAEMDRALRGYLRQGVSKSRATNLVATSVLFCMAQEEGMEAGVDYRWHPDNGTFFSARMTQWVKSTLPEQAWNHMKMEGFITTANAPETEEEELERTMLTARGAAKFLLLTAQDPADTNDGGEAARRHSIEMMVAGGLPQSDAEGKLRRFLAGDESLMEGMLDHIEVAFTAMARQQQEGSADG